MNNDINKIIGGRINTLLAVQNKKQKDLAENLGVKPNVISYYVSGERTPNTEQLKKISEFFNASSDYLLGLSNAATLNTSIQDIHHITGLSEKAIDKLIFIKNLFYNSSSELEEKGVYEDEWVKTINYLIETVLTKDKNKKGHFVKGIVAELSDYYSLYSSGNDQEVYVLSTGKVFSDLEEAKAEAIRIAEGKPEKKVTIGCIKTNEMLENMWMDRLKIMIRESKDAYFEYVDGMMGDKPEKK